MYTIFLGFALLASAITINKLILVTLSPTFFVALRMLASGALLIGYHSYASPRLRFKYIQDDIITILLIAFCATFVPSVLKAYALKYMVSSKAAFLGSLDPFITAFYAYILWNERLKISQILGIALAFMGTSLVLFMNSPQEQTLTAWWVFSYPELAAIAAVFILRYGWILAQKLLKAERYMPSELNGIIMFIGGLYALLASVYFNECDFCTIPRTWEFFALFSYTVIVGNIIAYTIYGYSLKHYNVTLVSLAGLSVPLWVHLYGPIILGEKLSLLFFVALAIMAAGLALFNWTPKKI